MSSIDRRNLIAAVARSRVQRLKDAAAEEAPPKAKRTAPMGRNATGKAMWRRRDRVVRKALGHCVDCNGQRHLVTTTRGARVISRCAEHKARHDAWDMAHYLSRKSAGLCQCGAPAVPERTLCATCGERNRLGAKARRAAQRESRR